jgi:hypothetical protein
MELGDAPGPVPIAPGSADPRDEASPVHSFGTLEELIGKRVQIRAVKAYGSARLLNGLTGTVVAVHPIARGWVKLDLDQNSRTPHRDWSVAVDRLVLVDPEVRPEHGPGLE